MWNIAILTGILSAQVALGHMEMVWPYPLRSKYNPQNDQTSFDYNMVAPLDAPGTPEPSGSSGPYPCKGYLTDPKSNLSPVVSWDAGASINYTLTGGATHNGGSCQLALSYDQGSTWSVIESIIGGCVVESLTESVTIPKEAPSGKAIFAWSWFNKDGNREMYQNCAVVTINNGGSGLDPTDYPAPFVANVEAAKDCATVGSTEAVFPNPGKNVKYGGTYKDGGATPGEGITGDCAAGSSGGGAASSAAGTGGAGQTSAAATDAAPTTASSSSSSLSSSADSTASQAASTTPSAPDDGAKAVVDSSSSSDSGTAAPTAPTSSSSSGDAATAVGSSGSAETQNCSRPQRKRHNRLRRRSGQGHLARAPKRVAAQPATHLDPRDIEERDPKRVAAQPATHLDHRDIEERDPKRVAAQPATHLDHREIMERDPKRVAAQPATHLDHRGLEERDPKRVAAQPATHLEHRSVEERDPKRVAAQPATHLDHRGMEQRDPKRVAAQPATHQTHGSDE